MEHPITSKTTTTPENHPPTREHIYIQVPLPIDVILPAVKDFGAIATLFLVCVLVYLIKKN